MNIGPIWNHSEGPGIPAASIYRLKDIGKIKNVVIENLKGSYFYHKINKISQDPFVEYGVLNRDFLLSDLRISCGYLRGELFPDNSIIKILSDLGSTGKLIINNLENSGRYNFKFSSEIGRAKKSFKGSTVSFISLEYYFDSPLENPTGIINIGEEIFRIRASIEEKFKKKFGSSGLEMERKLHHEQVIDDIDLKKRLIEKMNT